MQPFMQTKGYKDHGVLHQRRINQAVLRDATVRDFSGGWNIVDSELNLDSRYQIVSDNVVREEDGSLGIRYGTQLFKEFSTGDDIINMVYFFDQLVVFRANGVINGVYGDGSSYIITSAWGAHTFVSFTPFKAELICANGINKPLRIYTDDPTANPVVLKAGYLQNPNTVSNANVPVARYVTSSSEYLIFGNSLSAGAGTNFGENWLHISARGKPGLFNADYVGGDLEASTATDVDIGEWGVLGDHRVTGLSVYRERVIVGTPNAVVLGVLGKIVVNAAGDDTHEPDFSDVLDGVGVHSHRSMINTGNDLLFVDHIGVVSLEKSRFSGDVTPQRVSELIDPKLNANLSRLYQVTVEDNVFGVYNSREKRYMLFVPNRDPVADIERMPDNPFFIDEFDENVLHMTWPSHNLEVGEKFLIEGMASFNNIDAADYNNYEFVVTRVIDENAISIAAVNPIDLNNSETFGGGSTVDVTPIFSETFGYVYTDIRSLKVKSWTRFRNWKWSCGCQTELSNVFFAVGRSIYRYGNSAAPLYEDLIGDADGPLPIEWVAEFPWADINVRMKEKVNRYIAFDTTGDSAFTCMMFVDELYKKVGALIPNNIREFMGGDSAGYGDGTQNYGGGIHTADERLTAWIARFKLAKIRLQGSSSRPLRIISVSLAYQQGDYRR